MFAIRFQRVRSFLLLILIASLLVSGCGRRGRSGKKVISDEVHQGEQKELKLIGDAYAFRIRIKQKKKPTTLKLNIYQTTNELALFARAYLGKGALKGKLNGDTLLAYFPTTNEYLLEPLSSLLSSGNCYLPSNEFILTDLLSKRPDSVKLGEKIRIQADYSEERHPKFLLTGIDCGWELELTYDQKKTGWRIRHFKFRNGKEFSVEGWREKYKGDTKLKKSYFNIEIPDGAGLVTP